MQHHKRILTSSRVLVRLGPGPGVKETECILQTSEVTFTNTPRGVRSSRKIRFDDGTSLSRTVQFTINFPVHHRTQIQHNIEIHCFDAKYIEICTEKINTFYYHEISSKIIIIKYYNFNGAGRNRNCTVSFNNYTYLTSMPSHGSLTKVFITNKYTKNTEGIHKPSPSNRLKPKKSKRSSQNSHYSSALLRKSAPILSQPGM